jgi:hypothetical protein
MCVEPLSASSWAKKKISVHPSVEKNKHPIRGVWGLMQAMNRGFRGLFCSFWLV